MHGSTHRIQFSRRIRALLNSRFSTAFDGTERFYKFGCSRFSASIMMFDEVCTTTETASTENGDMYLSCGSDQYTVGIEVVEDVTTGVDSWQLLCCKSDSIKLRHGDCIDTKFINDHRRPSTFSSSAQIIRRWQAMSENGDRRWWLQLCPVDIDLKKPKAPSEIRARRQVPWEWSRGRFPALSTGYNPLLSASMRMEDEMRRKTWNNVNRIEVPSMRFSGNMPKQLKENPYEDKKPAEAEEEEVDDGYHYRSRLRLIEEKVKSKKDKTLKKESSTNRMSYYKSSSSELPKVVKPVLSTTTVSNIGAPLTFPTLIPMNWPNLNWLNSDKNWAINSKKEEQKKKPNKTVPNGEKPIEALDYYDLYDEHFDKEKHQEAGIFSGVSELFQNLQDGLTLAEASFPNNFKIQIELPPSSTPSNFMFANDENSLSVGSFVQQNDLKKHGPLPKRPTGTEKKTRQESNTIEKMLQMFGLCGAHKEL